MNYLKVILFFSIFGNVIASDFSTSKAEFCENSTNDQYQKDLLETKSARLAFRNQGGLFGGGVCWWHSRFTRNVSYLAIFRPDLPKPSTDKEAYKIIHDIRKGREVVTVPGFENLYEFSAAYPELIQKQLNAWQRHDGIINQSWLQGLFGKTKTSAKRFKKKMNKLFSKVDKGEVVFQVLQLKGVTAHAWLVIDMLKTASGYDLRVIDSNFPVSTNVYRYREGMKSFTYSYYGNFVPYTYKNGELRRLKRIGAKFCKK